MSGRPSWLDFGPEDYGYEVPPVQDVLLAGEGTDAVGTDPLFGVDGDKEIGCTIQI